MGPNRLLRVRRRRVARRAACVALAVAALAGCAPDDRPGPRGLLRVDAPVLVAMDGAPVADGAPARVAAPRDAGARLVGRVAAGVGAMAVTPGARMLAAPLAVLDAAPADADCPARDDALREAVDTLRAALRPVAHAATEAMRVGVDREWHPTRPDPVVAAAGAPPRLEAALEAGHRTLLRIGPVTLSPTTRATPEGAGCRAAIEARVVLRAIRTADGGVRFESVRRLTLAEAPDEDALRAWAADPGRVEDALRRLGDRIADDVRWLL